MTDHLTDALLATLEEAGVIETLADRLAARVVDRLSESLDLGGGANHWLTSKEAAAYLGLPSVHAIHKLSSAHAIPFVQDRPGARLYFRRSNLDAWRERQRVADR